MRWLPKIRYDEMHTLYVMADAVVNYPARDSFPATLVEAAACETPAITAFLPTYRDTFVETACTLVEPEQPRSARRGDGRGGEPTAGRTRHPPGRGAARSSNVSTTTR